MKNVTKALTTLAILFLFVSCEETYFREEKVFAGGLVVDAKTLNKGRDIYRSYCMACHGVDGKGDGVASKGLSTPPRDLTQGQYKFGKVIAGELPRDEDFYDIFKRGLHGTAMLPWDLTEGQLFAITQYIKTFAPQAWEGKDKTVGERIVVTKDPYGMAHKAAAIEKGKEVYHMVANCQSCHTGYVSHAELSKMNQKYYNEPLTYFDETLYAAKPQESEYNYAAIPPDFTWNFVRSAKTVEEIYVRLVAGVAGTSMPSWKDTIADDEIWAVAHYVRSLMDLKESPKREEFFKAIRDENAKVK